MSDNDQSAAAPRRHTKQRRAVEDALVAADDFASAQELHARLRESGSTIGLATVYRTLSGLVDEGRVDLLRSPDGEARYRSCGTENHHHHLVCRTCGRTVDIAGPAVERWADEVAAQHGFTGVSHTVELFGQCAECTQGH